MVKNLPANADNAGDAIFFHGSERSPGEVNVNPLQYSCLENPMDRGVWRATGYVVVKSQTRLSTHAYIGLGVQYTLYDLVLSALTVFPNKAII